MSMQYLKQQLEAFGITPTVVVFKRGEFIFKAGSIANAAYYIEKGAVSVLCDIGQDEDQVIRFGYAGNMLSALDSFISGAPSIYSIQALKQTRVLQVSKEDLQRFWQHGPDAEAQWIKIMESMVLQQMEREVDLLINDPLKRYRRVAGRSPELFQQVPHKYIANYLRMSPETLSRLKKY